MRDVRARPAPSQRTGPRGPPVPGESARQADVSGGARSEGDRKVAGVVERGAGTRRAVSVGGWEEGSRDGGPAAAAGLGK
jgi:hypothetical protein